MILTVFAYLLLTVAVINAVVTFGWGGDYVLFYKTLKGSRRVISNMLLFISRVLWILALPIVQTIWLIMQATQGFIVALGLQDIREDNVGDFEDFMPKWPVGHRHEYVLVNHDEYDYDEPVSFDTRRGWLFEAYKWGDISRDEYLDDLDELAKEEKLLTELSNEAREQLEDAQFDLDAYVKERLEDRTDDTQADIIATYQKIYGTPEALAEDKFTVLCYGVWPIEPVEPLGVETMNVNGMDIKVGITRQDEMITVRGINYPEIVGHGRTVTQAKYHFTTVFQSAYFQEPICEEELEPVLSSSSYNREID